MQEGGLVVLPTDTVYGIGADAFTPSAVSALLAAKGRGRSMPPPVLVGSVRAAAALTESLGAFGQDLIDEFWPGPLTLVFRASPTLKWDLGDTTGHGRGPHAAAPGRARPAAADRADGGEQCQPARAARRPRPPTRRRSSWATAVSVYLDGGPCADNVPSTILDLTGTVPRMLRAGVVTVDQLRKVVPVIDLPVPQPAEPDIKPAEPHPLAGGDPGTGS